MMKKYFFLIILLYSTNLFSQRKNSSESLNEFFAGIPLQQSFSNWVQYLSTHPFLGIDSINKRGIYSSLKSGINDYFPFSDSHKHKIKILLEKTTQYDSVTKISKDSLHEIGIEAVFAYDKIGKKESKKVFIDVWKKLKIYYYDWYRLHEKKVQRLKFIEGKSKNYPDCYLQQGYEADLKMYYVMLWYRRTV